MDINFDLTGSQMSLQRITSVRVVSQMVATYREIRHGVDKCTYTVQEVRDFIDQLEITKEAKECLQVVVEPIFEALVLWYNEFSYVTIPIFTPWGTIDMVSSTRALLDDEDLHLISRFILACTFGHEKHIFELGKQLSTEDIKNFKRDSLFWEVPNDKWSEFASLWLRAYDCKFDIPISGQNLPENLCNLGLKLGFLHELDFPVRYFMDKVSPEWFSSHVKSSVEPNWRRRLLVPSTYCNMYAKCSKEDQEWLLDMFSYRMLDTLIRWPNQKQFLEAAKVLTKNLCRSQFWDIAYTIATGTTWQRDADYRGIFREFWKLGHDQRSRSSFADNERYMLVVQIFLSGDLDLATMVLNDLAPGDKQILLFGFMENMICSLMLGKGWHQLLGLFVRTCGMGNERMLRAFKRQFLRECEIYPGGHWFCDPGHYMTDEQWKDNLQHLAQLVDMIIEEIQQTTVPSTSTRITNLEKAQADTPWVNQKPIGVSFGPVVRLENWIYHFV